MQRAAAALASRRSSAQTSEAHAHYPLTVPTRPGGPGVCGVGEILKLIRARIKPDGLRGAEALAARQRLQTSSSQAWA